MWMQRYINSSPACYPNEVQWGELAPKVYSVWEVIWRLVSVESCGMGRVRQAVNAHMYAQRSVCDSFCSLCLAV